LEPRMPMGMSSDFGRTVGLKGVWDEILERKQWKQERRCTQCGSSAGGRELGGVVDLRVGGDSFAGLLAAGICDRADRLVRAGWADAGLGILWNRLGAGEVGGLARGAPGAGGGSGAGGANAYPAGSQGGIIPLAGAAGRHGRNLRFAGAT